MRAQMVSGIDISRKLMSAVWDLKTYEMSKPDTAKQRRLTCVLFAPRQFAAARLHEGGFLRQRFSLPLPRFAFSARRLAFAPLDLKIPAAVRTRAKGSAPRAVPAAGAQIE